MKTKNNITSLRILATLGLGANFAIATPIFVDQASTSVKPDGSSWTNAYKSLDDALNAAGDAEPSSTITEIRVARGTYIPRNPNGFALIDNVDLLGGYGGSTSSTPSARTFTTTLSGDMGITGDPEDNCFHVLIAAGYGDGAAVDGFTITNGNAAGIGSDSTSSEELGGGIYISNVSVTVRNCTFNANRASAFGGGAAVMDSGAGSRFEYCTFYDNEGGENGGGVFNGDYQSGTPLMILTCRFAGNRSERGGGIYTGNSTGIAILNSGFTGNEADYDGGAIFISSGADESLVSNCSILQNSAGLSSGLGGGIAGNVETLVYNSLIWGNLGSGRGLANNIYLLSSGNIRNCCITGWFGGGSTISSLPRLVGLAGSDGVVGTPDDRFEVRVTSPLINAGNDSLVHADVIAEDVDLGGRDRFNGTVDIGAMEY